MDCKEGDYEVSWRQLHYQQQQLAGVTLVFGKTLCSLLNT